MDRPHSTAGEGKLKRQFLEVRDPAAVCRAARSPKVANVSLETNAVNTSDHVRANGKFGRTTFVGEFAA